MPVDWMNVIDRLAKYQPRVHRLRPSCSPEAIRAAESKLGKMPHDYVSMLLQFNGAKLFISGGPFITVFGISETPPLPPLEWARDWYVDRFTPIWRQATPGRESDLTIAMKNYGGLVVLDADGKTREWDTATKRWQDGAVSIEEWIEEVLCDGDTMLRELGN